MREIKACKNYARLLSCLYGTRIYVGNDCAVKKRVFYWEVCWIKKKLLYLHSNSRLQFCNT